MSRKANKIRSDKGILRGHVKGSQADKILKRLKEGYPITSWTAIQDYKCTRLSSIIFNLKKEGHNIETKKILNDNGNSFAQYKMKDKERPLFNLL